MSAPAPSSVISVSNRQRLQRLDSAAVLHLAHSLLDHLQLTADLGIEFVGPKRMAQLNMQFLQHEGSTDVITFDHGSSPSRLHGDIAICVADAVSQATEFRTTWPEEVTRYVIHGILHLLGYDDLTPTQRRAMKLVENRLLKLAKRKGWHQVG